jgi:drug/metabolite transporter (DMT)-like permease
VDSPGPAAASTRVDADVAGVAPVRLVAPAPLDAPRPRRLAHSRRTAFLLLIVLVVIWGSHWTVVKIGLRDLPPFTYGAARLALAVAILAGIQAARGKLRRPPRADLPVILSVGIIQIGLAIALMNIALQFVPPGRSSVLSYTTPLWVALMLAIVWHQRPTLPELVGLALGLIGVCLLVNPAAIDWGSPNVLAGTGLLLASAAGVGLTFIHVRRHRWVSRPIDVLPWQLLVALPMLAVLAVALEGGEAMHWQAQTAFVLLFSAVLATAFAFWASQSITIALGPMVTSVGFLATPVVALVVSAVATGERVTPMEILGILITIAGIAVVSVAPRASLRSRVSQHAAAGSDESLA